MEPLRTAAQLDAGSYEAWQNLGLSLYWLRRYREALPALEKAAALNPQSFDTLNLLAAALHALGDDAAALPILERAHSLNPLRREIGRGPRAHARRAKTLRIWGAGFNSVNFGCRISLLTKSPDGVSL